MDTERSGAASGGSPEPPTRDSDKPINAFQLAIEEAQRRGAGPVLRPTPAREGTADDADRAAA